LSYFVSPMVVGGALWRWRHELFERYVVVLLIVYYFGLVASFLLPTAPPWLASDSGQLPYVEKVGDWVYGAINLEPQARAAVRMNPVAAMPSLHMAITMVVALALARFKTTWAIVGASYAFLMAFALVYLGEHYVVDEVIGVILGASVWATVFGRRPRWSSPLTANVSARSVTARLQPSAKTTRIAIRLVALLALAALPVLLAVPFLDESVVRDEGVYATVANGLLHGQLPYRDLFDHKPPVIYLWYAASFQLFGQAIEPVRILGALHLSAATICLFLIGRTLLSPRCGWCTAGAFAASTGLSLLEPNLNIEPFVSAYTSAALFAFVCGVRFGAMRWYVAAGALSGLAIVTKQVAVLNFAALFVALVLMNRNAPPGLAHWRPAAAMAAAAGAVGLLIVVPFIWAGAFADFWYANVTYNQLYAGSLSWGERFILVRQGTVGFAMMALPLLLLVAAGVWRLARVRSNAAVVLLPWLVGSLLGVYAPGRLSLHYFIVLLPACALLAGYALAEWDRIFVTRLARHAGALLLTGAVVLAIAVQLPAYRSGNRAERNSASNASLHAERGESAEEAGEYLKLHSPEDARVFNFGRATGIYFYAHRTPASRMIYDRPFWLDPKTLSSTLSDLRSNPPLYIADTMTSAVGSNPQGADESARRTPEMIALLDELYVLETTIDTVLIYRLRGE
jgi:membrane-associated phospholipid phosphatase